MREKNPFHLVRVRVRVRSEEDSMDRRRESETFRCRRKDKTSGRKR